MTVSIANSVDEASGLLADAPSPVVVIAVHDAYDDAVCCLEAVVANTSPEITILIVEDASTDRRLVELLATVAARVAQPGRGAATIRQRWLRARPATTPSPRRRPRRRGPQQRRGRRAGVARPAERRRPSSDTIATATTLTNHGTILSVPHRNRPVTTLLDGMTPDEAARRVAGASQQLRPTIPTAIGHCFYIRRRALDLVGPFDLAFDPGYGEEVDFSQRALAHGFRHIVADDVFTYHRGGEQLR